MMTVIIIFGFHHFSSKKTQNHSQLLLVKLSVRNFYKKPSCSCLLCCFLFVSLKKKEAQRMAKPLLECERGYREASVGMCEYLSEGESLQVSRWLVGFAACLVSNFHFITLITG